MDPGVFFGKRPFCRLSEALEVAADVAVHAEEPVDIVIVPPEPSVDTDVEEADDDGTTDTVVNDVSEGGNSEVRPKCVFSCGACGELFSAQDLLEKHRRRKHPQRPEGRHCCAHCPYSSDRKPNVVRHVRTHTGWRPFLCQVCGKGFARLDHLTGHQLVHSGEGLHECPDCGQRFSQASNQTGCSPQGAALCGRRGCLAPVYPLREVVQP
ncbi:uncharacterized protein LOC144114845 [Amblyomma americanum]